MKIGLVLFGNLRSFRNTLSSFNQLKQTLEKAGTVDIFCHTWDNEESATSSWWKDHKAGNPPPATVNKSEIEKTYQPVKLIIEPSVQFDDSAYKINASIPVAGILSMLYSQQQAFQLLVQHEEKQGVKYDVVIKTRYDLLYEIAPAFNKQLADCIARNCVYLPSSNPYELAGSSSDIFAMGSRGEMEKYFSFCSNFEQASAAYFRAGYRQLIPELCMTVYLQQSKVAIEELSGMRLHILRMNNEKFQINSDKNFTDNLPQCFFKVTIDANLQVLPEEKPIYSNNKMRLVKKYMSWIDAEAGNDILEKYAGFYSGTWIGVTAVSRLAVKGKRNPVFTSGVMKSFFEEALYSAKYNFFKKFMVASTLFKNTENGWFYFRELKKHIFKKEPVNTGEELNV